MGMWIDNSHAIIIANDNEAGTYAIGETVKVNDHHVSGSEHTMNNAEQGNNLKYFKSIAALLLDYDEILIFGPGTSQEQFHNFLKEDAQFNNKRITIDSTGNQTEPQMIAKVRDFFGNSN